MICEWRVKGVNNLVQTCLDQAHYKDQSRRTFCIVVGGGAKVNNTKGRVSIYISHIIFDVIDDNVWEMACMGIRGLSIKVENYVWELQHHSHRV